VEFRGGLGVVGRGGECRDERRGAVPADIGFASTVHVESVGWWGEWEDRSERKRKGHWHCQAGTSFKLVSSDCGV
jgi:hypothetical protein